MLWPKSLLQQPLKTLIRPYFQICILLTWQHQPCQLLCARKPWVPKQSNPFALRLKGPKAKGLLWAPSQSNPFRKGLLPKGILMGETPYMGLHCAYLPA